MIDARRKATNGAKSKSRTHFPPKSSAWDKSSTKRKNKLKGEVKAICKWVWWREDRCGDNLLLIVVLRELASLLEVPLGVKFGAWRELAIKGVVDEGVEGSEKEKKKKKKGKRQGENKVNACSFFNEQIYATRFGIIQFFLEAKKKN